MLGAMAVFVEVMADSVVAEASAVGSMVAEASAGFTAVEVFMAVLAVGTAAAGIGKPRSC